MSTIRFDAYTNANTLYNNYGLFGSAGSTTAANYSSLLLNKSSSIYGTNNTTTSKQTQSYLTDVKSVSSLLKESLGTFTSKDSSSSQQVATTKSSAFTLATDTSKLGTASDAKSEMSLFISSVASKQSNIGQSWSSNAINAVSKGKSGSNQMTIEKDGKSYDLNISVGSTDSYKTVQQKTADAINKLGIGVNAYISSDSKTGKASLIVESKETGEANAFTISDKADGGNLAAKLGINAVTTQASDAVYKINDGAVQKSSTNKIELREGITATISSTTDSAAKISFGKDENKLINTVYDMVNNFNALMETAQDNNDNKGAKMLESQLKGLTKSYSASLSKIGIKSDSLGYLVIDKTKLEAAVKNGDTVEKALGSSSNGVNYGFTTRLNQIATKGSADPMNFYVQSGYDTYYASSNTNKYQSQNFYSMYNNYSVYGLLFDSFM